MCPGGKCNLVESLGYCDQSRPELVKLMKALTPKVEDSQDTHSRISESRPLTSASMLRIICVYRYT